MAYNANTNFANERKYLNNLISGGGGNAEWAKNQLNDLNKAQQQYGGANNAPSTNTTAGGETGGKTAGGGTTGGKTAGGGTTGGKTAGGGTTGGGTTGGGTTGGGTYNAGTDYQSLIKSAVASGDYASAAKYEQQRNNKIQSEKLGYDTTNYYSDFLGGNKGAATKTTVNRGGEQLSAVVIGGKTYLTNRDGTFTGGKLKQGDAVSAANGNIYYYDEASGRGLTQEDYSKATRKATNIRANTDIRTGRRVETVDYVDGLGNITRAATVDGEPVQDGFTYNYVAPGDDGYEYEVTATWSSTGGEDGKGGWTESISNMPTVESYQAILQSLYDEYLEQAQAANQAAVDMSVKEIQANLENTLPEYSQSAAETYLKMLKAQQNQQLRNAAAGDLGGIGQKQYNEASAQYDAALLQIELEREAFINSCNQQIEQLKAQGRLQDAQILADWAQTKLEMYNENYKWYREMALQKQQIDFNQNAADREYYLNRAIGMLEKGILTEDALTALGISDADARNYAAMLNEEASVSLAYAKAQLNNLYQKSVGNGGGTPTTEQTDGGLYTIIRTMPNGEQVTYRKTKDELNGFIQDGDALYDQSGNLGGIYNSSTGELITEEEYRYNQKQVAQYNDWYEKYNGRISGNTANSAENLYAVYKAAIPELQKEIDALDAQILGAQNGTVNLSPNAPEQTRTVYNALRQQLDNANAKMAQYQAAVQEYERLMTGG